MEHEDDKVSVNGRVLERRMEQVMRLIEHDTGIPLEGRLVQGSFNHGVSASAGTHDGDPA